MEGNTIQYTPLELVSFLEGFCDIYKPFANYQKKQHPLWIKCLETLKDFNKIEKIVFCNDFLNIPPVKLFLCLSSEVAEGKNLTTSDKKFIGCFWSYLFTSIFCYKFKKQVAIKSLCIKTALYFYGRKDGIVISPDKEAIAEKDPPSQVDKMETKDTPKLKKVKKEKIENESYKNIERHRTSEEGKGSAE